MIYEQAELDDYLFTMSRVSKHYLCNDENYEIFKKNSIEYAARYSFNILDVSLEFLKENNIKLAQSKTILHFYDYKTFTTPLSNIAIKGGEEKITLEHLKNFAYVYAVTETRVCGILKQQIAKIESESFGVKNVVLA